jgi:hypothetical protein
MFAYFEATEEFQECNIAKIKHGYVVLQFFSSSGNTCDVV